jgi:hypothetical protein
MRSPLSKNITYCHRRNPIRPFRDGHHIAGRLMTLVLLWAGTVGCPMKVGGPRTVGPGTVRVPGGTCRKAAGNSHPPSRLYMRQSRRGFPSTASRPWDFYLVSSVRTSCLILEIIRLPTTSQLRRWHPLWRSGRGCEVSLHGAGRPVLSWRWRLGPAPLRQLQNPWWWGRFRVYRPLAEVRGLFHTNTKISL